MSFVKGYKHISISLLTKSMHLHKIAGAIAMIDPLFFEILRSYGDHSYLQYIFSELTKMCPKFMLTFILNMHLLDQKGYVDKLI